MAKKIEREIRKQLTGTTLVFAVLFLIIGLAAGFFGYQLLNKKDSNETIIHLNGEDVINIKVGDTYVDGKCVIVIDGEDYSQDVEIVGSVDTSKEGSYVIKYVLEEFNISLIRIVNVSGGESDGN